MNATTSPFTFLWDGYFVNFAATTAQQIAVSLAAIATVITGILTLYIIALGVTMMWGKASWAELQARIVRAAIVIAFVSPSLFNVYIVDFFQNRLPTFATQAATGNASPGITIAQQFSQLNQAVENMVLTAEAQTEGILSADIGMQGVAQRLEIALVGAVASGVLLVCFLIAAYATTLIGLTLNILSITFVGYLFRATTGIAERTVSKLIGLSLVIFIVEIVMQRMLIEDRLYLGTLGGVGASVPAMISSLWHLVWVFVAGLMGLAVSVTAAVYIGGGVSFSAISLASAFLLRAGGIGRRARA